MFLQIHLKMISVKLAIKAVSRIADFHATRLAAVFVIAISALCQIQAIGAAARISFSSYLGGTDFDFPQSITVDRFGNIYIVGSTRSKDFPLVNAAQKRKRKDHDAFLT